MYVEIDQNRAFLRVRLFALQTIQKKFPNLDSRSTTPRTVYSMQTLRVYQIQWSSIGDSGKEFRCSFELLHDFEHRTVVELSVVSGFFRRVYPKQVNLNNHADNGCVPVVWERLQLEHTAQLCDMPEHLEVEVEFIDGQPKETTHP